MAITENSYITIGLTVGLLVFGSAVTAAYTRQESRLSYHDDRIASLERRVSAVERNGLISCQALQWMLIKQGKNPGKPCSVSGYEGDQ